MKNQQPLSRRNFLKVGLSGAALSSLSLGAASSQTEPRLGLVLPDIAMGRALEQGFRQGLADDDYKLSATYVDAVGSRLGQQLKAFINSGRYDLVISFLPERGLVQLNDLLGSTPQLQLSLGANLLRTFEQNPNTSQLSLAQWQAEYALGAWAAGQLGQRALVLNNTNESGFDLAFAFIDGFRSQAGEVELAFTDRPDGSDISLAALGPALDEAPDVIYFMHRGNTALNLVHYLDHLGLTGLPLLCSGFSFTPAELAQLPPERQLYSASSWYHDYHDLFTSSQSQQASPAVLLGQLAANEMMGLLQGQEVSNRPDILRYRLSRHGAEAEGRLSFDHAVLAPYQQQPRSGWVEPYLV